MTTDTIVTVRDTAVMYVAGETGKPIAEQAPKAFKELEAKLPSLKGRKFYGVVLGNEYRACVAIDPNHDPLSLPHPAWVLPGGRYVRRRLPNWEHNLHLIGPTFETLRRRSDFDPSRPCIEFLQKSKGTLGHGAGAVGMNQCNVAMPNAETPRLSDLKRALPWLRTHYQQRAEEARPWQDRMIERIRKAKGKKTP